MSLLCLEVQGEGRGKVEKSWLSSGEIVHLQGQKHFTTAIQ